MVKHIVGLGTDLQSDRFVYTNSLSQRDIPEVRTGTAVVVSRQKIKIAHVTINVDAGKRCRVSNATSIQTNAVCRKIQKTIRKLRVLRHVCRSQHTRQGAGYPRAYQRCQWLGV